jgi:hypothetical protein
MKSYWLEGREHKKFMFDEAVHKWINKDTK